MKNLMKKGFFCLVRGLVLKSKMIKILLVLFTIIIYILVNKILFVKNLICISINLINSFFIIMVTLIYIIKFKDMLF